MIDEHLLHTVVTGAIDMDSEIQKKKYETVKKSEYFGYYIIIICHLRFKPLTSELLWVLVCEKIYILLNIFIIK